MILTQCACCAAPLPHLAKQCSRCKTRYCGPACQKTHWEEGGHKDQCKQIKRGGGAEQYHADKKCTAAVTVAAEACAEDTKGQTCYICTQAVHWKTKEGLVRMCSCRGTAGFAHVSCLAEQAKILVAEAYENNLDVKVKNARWRRWSDCSLCEQQYHGVVACALGWACWKTYLGRPETDWARDSAMNRLGGGLYAAHHFEDALSVGEAHLASMRRTGTSVQTMLALQSNISGIYDMLGRNEQALPMRQDVYSACLKYYGEGDPKTLLVVNNYAHSLFSLRRFKEGKSLLRKTIPVARRILGENHNLTLRMRKMYARALYKAGGATLADFHEAVTTLEELERTARRVLGGAYPLTEGIEEDLQNARAVLRARKNADDAVESLREAVAAMMPGDAQGEVLAPTA